MIEGLATFLASFLLHLIALKLSACLSEEVKEDENEFLQYQTRSDQIKSEYAEETGAAQSCF